MSCVPWYVVLSKRKLSGPPPTDTWDRPFPFLVSLEVAPMPATRSRKSRSPRFTTVIQKPRGVIHPRVQLVGPEHFGIVSVDCAKARFKWMFCDFYGNILVPPTEVAHNRVELDAALAQLQEARTRHDIRDLVVAVERTGRYHHVPRHAFAKVCADVRTVPPFTTKHFRQPG